MANDVNPLLDHRSPQDLEVLPGYANHTGQPGAAVASDGIMMAVGKDIGNDGNDKGLHEKARSKFRHFATEGERLPLDKAAQYVASVAAECNIASSKLTKPDPMFWRFDFSGDGTLDEDEAVKMAASMVRTIQRRERNRANPRGRFGDGWLNNGSVLGKGFRNLEDDFLLGKKLGQGGQGAIWTATEKATGAHRVIKSYVKGEPNMPEENIQEEFAILRQLDHPHIQRLYDIFEDRHNIYVASEPYEGGDLTNLVPRAAQAGVPVTNVYLSTVMRQAIQGVAYVHSKQIIHCDLKEPNCMVTGRDLHEPGVVVIDFGLANRFSNAKQMACGTPGYIPPEVWTEQMWTPKGDIFSLGVMLFQLFTGKRCFPCMSIAACKRITCQEDPNFRQLSSFERLDSLVESMLKKDFRQRPTGAEVLQNKFFLAAEKMEDDNVKALPEDVVDSLCHLKKKSDTLMAVMVDIAQLENLGQMQKLNTLFTTMDANGDGKIDAKELEQALGELPEEKRQKVADALLMDGSDNVMYTMFMGQMMHALTADMNRILTREFQTLDKDRNGYLSTEEVAVLLKRPALGFLKKEPDELMKIMDKDKNGNISFEEFAQALGGGVDDGNDKPERRDKQAITIRSQYTVNTEADAISEEDLPETMKVKWTGNMRAISTTWAMKGLDWSVVIGHVLGLGLCCWWVPLVFILGATNVDDGCEQPLDVYLILGAILLTVFVPVANCIMVCAAKMRLKALFRFVRSLPTFGWFLVIAWFVLGIVWYAQIKDKDACVKDEDGAVNPVGLIFAWFFCMLPFSILALCIVVCLSNSLQQAMLAGL